MQGKRLALPLCRFGQLVWNKGPNPRRLWLAKLLMLPQGDLLIHLPFRKPQADPARDPLTPQLQHHLVEGLNVLPRDDPSPLLNQRYLGPPPRLQLAPRRLHQWPQPQMTWA